MRGVIFLAMAMGCAGSRAEPERRTDGVAADAADAAVTVEARRWIAGDLHQHAAPFDTREGAALQVKEMAQRGAAAGLEFVIATPHLWQSTLAVADRRRAWMAKWTAMAAEARAATGITVIPGAEYTVGGFGHFGVSGVDLAALRGDDLLAAARDGGGFVVVNHPFAVPTQIPGIPVSDRDLSFRPWTDGVGAMPPVDAVEVWNLPLGLANIASRPGGLSGEERAWAAADALARRERRRVGIVGGSDSHGPYLIPTTWVLAADASEAAILAGLRAGATCVGGPDAGELAAHGDADPPDRWARIGEAVAARARVELHWSGTATVFVDGVDRGAHDGGWIHDGAAGVHTYRLVRGASRCGFVYANL